MAKETLRVPPLLPQDAEDLILLRATVPDAASEHFAQHLEHASGCPVVYVLDERHGPVSECEREKIGLTGQLIKGLGLYRPTDFTWRCGDYCYYAARAKYPRAQRFWLIEHDVRICRAAPFFEAVGTSTRDFLAVDLKPAALGWFWFSYTRNRDTEAWRCLFPVTRLTVGAIDLLYKVRREHSRQWLRKAAWPNDESFVATTISGSSLSKADFNTVYENSWEPDSFRVGNATSGETLDLEGESSALLHPILWGDRVQTTSRSSKPNLNRFELRTLRRVVGFLNKSKEWFPTYDTANNLARSRRAHQT